MRPTTSDCNNTCLSWDILRYIKCATKGCWHWRCDINFSKECLSKVTERLLLKYENWWVHILVQAPLEVLNEGKHDSNYEFNLCRRDKERRWNFKFVSYDGHRDVIKVQDPSSRAKPRTYVCSSIYAHSFNAIMATVMQIVIKLMRRWFL